MIADLDSKSFSQRQSDQRGLEEAGEAAVPMMRETLAGGPTLEMRRGLEAVLAEIEAVIPSAARLQSLRALEVLERISNGQARQHLQQMSGDAMESPLTQRARAALERLSG